MISAQSAIYCLDCDYPLVHAAKGTCPECGRAYDIADKKTFGRKRRSHSVSVAATFVVAVYPLLLTGFICASWLSAWAYLGRIPQPTMDDPKTCAAGVLLIPSDLLSDWVPVAFVVQVVAILWATVTELLDRRRVWMFAGLITVPVAAWLFPILLFGAEPFDIIVWFLD